MAKDFLVMRNISKRFAGVRALEEVDFSIAEGEIHCLVGENGSGKSTLIKIISGVEQPDPGAEISIRGERIESFQSIDTIKRGVEVIYQDLSLFPNLSVLENISVSQIVERGRRLYDWQEARRIARQAMDKIGISLPFEEPVGELSTADQQLVAICRALTSDLKLLIMDEPTSSLTRKEVDNLFAVVQDLKTRSIATLFVSHKLNEIFQIAERVIVLRDGRRIGTFPREELNNKKLAELMTGRKLEYARFTYRPRGDIPLLEVRNLSKKRHFHDISFTLFPGEILGLTGLLGSGRTELALALFGMNRPDSGQICIEGRLVRIRSVPQAMRLGIGYLPESRLSQGLVMDQAIGRNLAITIIRRLVGRLNLIDEGRVESSNRQWVNDLNLKLASLEAPVSILSGGNQQRVVLGKWMAIAPKILILDGPTIGIDVAAKGSIHEIIRGLAAKGIGIIVISDEVGEVLHNCSRILLMKRGAILRELNSEEVEEAELQRLVNEG